ncbi:MAG: hypothetical protein KGL39_38675 [Patescibacteria group bacterium]|nr:hypothetical protein [Patescibacteria group bacterium]
MSCQRHSPDQRFWSSKNDDSCPLCMREELEQAKNLVGALIVQGGCSVTIPADLLQSADWDIEAAPQPDGSVKCTAMRRAANG